MKKVLVTGGAGFIGTNLIKNLLDRDIEVISLDDYSTGSETNEFEKASYLKMDIEEIESMNDNNFDTCFHLAAQSRVQPSFQNPEESVRVNVTGTMRVMEWAKKNNVKVIYAGSSSRHHQPSDSPYAMTKYLGEGICKLYRKSFGIDVDIARFYNVYGPNQITNGSMATVIGIFEECYKKNKPLTIVKPGTQTRRFTHIDDTVNVCYKAWKKNKCKHYSISHRQSYSILSVAKMFKSKMRFLPSRKGERYASALTNMSLTNKVHKKFGKIQLKDYVASFIKYKKK